MNDRECLFCKIATGIIPLYKVYEDSDVIAFLDINPVNPGHTLVLPKRHLKNLYELDNEILKKIMVVVRDLSIKIKKALNADGINIEMNNDRPAGQIVDHAHIHIVPRIDDDGLRHWPSRKTSDEELSKIAEKIRE